MKSFELEIPMEIARELVKKFGTDVDFFPTCKVVIKQNLDNVYLDNMLVKVDAHTHVYLGIEIV